MKKILFLLLCLVGLSSCEDSFNDDRSYQSGAIVAVKINNVLYNIEPNSDKIAKVILPAGVNLTAVKTEILVANGTLSGMDQVSVMDLRNPKDIAISGFDGTNSTWKLIVQSPPKLVDLSVVGLSIPKDKIYPGKTSIIVQVPVGTDITKLAASYTFVNGTVKNFVNGTVKDYSFNPPATTPFKLEVLGVDNTTTYTYDIVYTSDQVGPASISGLEINGIPTSRMIVKDAAKNILQPVVPYLSDFANATVTIKTPFGNVVDPKFNGANLNTLAGFKVKVTGTNGIETEFTIQNPLIESTPILEKSHASLGYSANAGSSVGFSGNSIVVAAHQLPAALPGTTGLFGIYAYDLQGNLIKSLDRGATPLFDGGAVTGIRKLATDDNGKILGVQLGAGAGATVNLNIVKWNSINDTAPTNYITYSQTSLGLTYAARSAGISIKGSLDGNAVITVPIASKTDVLVWTVTNGVLNPTPTKQALSYAGVPGNYYSVQPNDTGFAAATVGTGHNGLALLGSSFSESAKSSSGNATSDCKTITYKNRKYLAYVAQVGGKHVFRIVDYTTANTAALDAPIMEITGPAVSNANITVDADFAVINNKLHVMFFATNDRLAVYQLEK